MIRRCNESELEEIWVVINDGAKAYGGVIPADCIEEPYMSRERLQQEVQEGVVFWAYEQAGTMAAVMGSQKVQDMTLIRHAYVRTSSQKQGLGGYLLSHLRSMAQSPILIGAWADASWAIRFYEKHGFQLVSPEEKARLLHKYWTVSDRQIETSVVLADPEYYNRQALPLMDEGQPSS